MCEPGLPYFALGFLKRQVVGKPDIDRKNQRTVRCFKKDTIKQYWV